MTLNDIIKTFVLVFIFVIALSLIIYLIPNKFVKPISKENISIKNKNTTKNENIINSNISNLQEKVVDRNGNVNTNMIYDIIKSFPYQNLSEKEKEGLIEMREEEKLARDVYLTLYNKWKLQIFKNIAGSEQTHTDSIKYLLEKYNISDPVTNDNIGEFSNPKFKELYNKLVDQGSKSIVDALKVGATIEDLDIADLEKWLNETDNEDIKFVYENLMKGSRNHMRAFVKMLSIYGEKYIPQYISKEEYEQIINSSMERGMGGGRWRQ